MKRKKISNQNTQTEIQWDSLEVQWFESFLTLLQMAMHYFFSKRNGHCSSKLKKEISFLSRQSQVAHISKGMCLPPRTNTIKSTEISETMKKSRDGCDIQCCLKSISDYRHWRKVRVCVCLCVCESKKERDRLSSRDGGWGWRHEMLHLWLHLCTFLILKCVRACGGVVVGTRHSASAPDFSHSRHRSILCDCLSLCVCVRLAKGDLSTIGTNKV